MGLNQTLGAHEVPVDAHPCTLSSVRLLGISQEVRSGDLHLHYNRLCNLTGCPEANSVWHFTTPAGSAFRQGNVATMPAATVRTNQPFFGDFTKFGMGHCVYFFD